MARTHARILTDIWADKDFKTLSRNGQHSYLMLLSQPDLGHSGLLAMTIRRWAGLSDDGSKEAVWAGLSELASLDFIVMDEDTEEVLIRSMVRNDGVWKQPKILAVAIVEASRISSPKLRARFAKELERIDVSSLPEKTQGLVKDLITDLPDALSQAHLEIEEYGFDAPPDPPVDPPPHAPSYLPADPPRGRGGGNGGTEGTTPIHGSPAGPPPAGPDEPGGELVLLSIVAAPEPKKASKPAKPKKLRAPEDDLADELTNGYWERYRETTAHKWISIRQIIRTALENGAHRDNVAWALDRLGSQRKPITSNTLTYAIGEVVKAREAQQQQPGSSLVPPPTGPVDFKQQATNNMFDRAMERARARDAMEAS